MSGSRLCTARPHTRKSFQPDGSRIHIQIFVSTGRACRPGSKFWVKATQWGVYAAWINKMQSSPCHPSSTGLIEHFNATLLDMIRMYVNGNQRTGMRTWPCWLLHIGAGPIQALNFHQTTLMHSREVKQAGQTTLQRYQSDIDVHNRCFDCWHLVHDCCLEFIQLS